MKYGQKRYFRCPAAVTVSHLQKLIRAKFELSPLQQVDIMYMGNPLESELSLMDITYIYAWKRKGSLELSYCIFDEPNKRIKLDLSSLQTVKTDDNIYLKETEGKTTASDMPMHYKSDGNDNVILESDKENESEKIHSKDLTLQKKQDEWKEIQLEIRENGIMLVRDVQKDDISPAKGNHQKMPSSQNEMETNLTRTSTLESKNRTQLEKSCAENFVTKNVSQDNTSAKEMPQNVSENNSLESNGHKNSNENETSIEQDKQITIENNKQMCKSLKILEDNNVSVTASTSPLQTIKYRIIPSHIVPVTQGKKRFCLEKNYSEPDSSVTEPYSTEAKKQNSLPLMMKVSPIVKPELYKCMSKHKKSSCNNECYKLVSPREYHDNSSCVKKDSLKMAIVAPTQLNKTQSNTCPFNYEPLNIPYRNWNPSIGQLRFNSPKPVSSSSNSNVSSSSNSNISSSNNSSVSSSSNSDVSSSSFSNVNKGTNPSLNTGQSKSGTILHANSTYALKNETNHNQKAKPPQLSKMRNVPRYLGNPASGVKPMYQVAPYDSVDSSKPKTSISVTKNNSTISNPVKSLSSNITSPPSTSFTASSSSKFSSTVQSRNLYAATTTVPSFSGYLNSLTVNKSFSPTISSASVLQNSKTTHNSRNVSHHHSLVSSSTDASYRSSNFPVTSPNATSGHDPLNVQNRLSYMPPPASFHLFSSPGNIVLNQLKARNTSEKSKQVLNSGLPAVQRIPPSNTQSRSNKLTGNTVIPPFVSQSINKTSISAVNKYNYIYSSATSSATAHSSNTAVSNVISSNSKGNESVAREELQKSENSKESVSQTFEPRTGDTRMSLGSSTETSSNEKTLTEPKSSDNKPEPLQVEVPNNSNS